MASSDSRNISLRLYFNETVHLHTLTSIDKKTKSKVKRNKKTNIAKKNVIGGGLPYACLALIP